MKYSYKWLQELSGTERTVPELVDLLTMHAFEVEETQPIGLESDRVIVGEVASLQAHPNADKLKVARVNIGIETLTIVCGAPNIAEGQRVAVALAGAILPGGFAIERATLRGVESNGMICSQKELGVSDDHEGIWVLTPSIEVGSLVRDIVGFDSLLDIKVLPDRAHDCLSHVGMAREIAALEGRMMDFDYESLRTKQLPWAMDFSAYTDEATKTRRYIGVHLKLGKLSVSPAWLQSRLKVFGMRSIHPIVDVTNFVMLELGQPLHAFDWAKISGGHEKNIRVRFAQTGEKLELLDEKTYELTSEDIVIADDEKALALAGIMGGKTSAVSNETTEILLESACFDPVFLRRTRVRHALRTDASDRFEKGLSPDLAERALARAIEILQHIATDAPTTDVGKAEVYPRIAESQVFSIDPQSINALLGVTVESTTAQECLRLLGFGIADQVDRWLVTVPAWRMDIEGVADLAEEVGRLVGYEMIPSRSPKVVLETPLTHAVHSLTKKIETFFVNRGLSEVYNYSFYSEQDAINIDLDKEKHLELANPMNPDQALMRATMLIGLLRNVRENLKHFDRVAIFENGRVTEREAVGSIVESKRLAGAIALSSGQKNTAFFMAKNVLGQLFASLGVSVEWEVPEQIESYWHPTQTARVAAVLPEGKVLLGTIGVVHPKVLDRMGIKQAQVALWECSLESMVEVLPKQFRAQSLQKFPTSVRDIAVFVPKGVTVANIQAESKAVGGDILLSVEAFDRYEESSQQYSGMTRVSLAFHLVFGAPDRTLSTEEVESRTAEILDNLQSKLGIEPRR